MGVEWRGIDSIQSLEDNELEKRPWLTLGKVMMTRLSDELSAI